MRHHAAAVALAAAAAFETLCVTAGAQQCDAPTNTLSFSCGSSCSTNQPCMRTSSSACDLECFAAPGLLFTFLIPYDTTVGDTATTPSKSNSELTKIGKWTLASTTTDVVVRGGSSLINSMKGKVAIVDIAADFLVGNDHVTLLRLANLNLSATISTLAPNFPPHIQQLGLSNTLLKMFPIEVAVSKHILTLVLSNNDITHVDQSHEINQLTTLYLDNNKVESFTAHYPKLMYLDLALNNLTVVPAVLAKYSQLKTLQLSGNKISDFNSNHIAKSIDTLQSLILYGNKLESFDAYIPNLTYLNLVSNNFKEIPSVVFSHAKLQELYIAGNRMLQNVTLTNAQANFVATLKNFTAEADTFSTSCDAAQQTTVQNFTVCIMGGPVNQSFIHGARAPIPVAPKLITTPSGESSSGAKSPSSQSDPGANTASTSASGSSSSTVTIILGCVAGVLTVALFVGFVYWKKHCDREAKTLTGTNYTSDSETDNTACSSGTTGSSGTTMALWNDPDLLAVKVNSDDVEDVKKIGTGAFCDVWLVKYRRSQRLAAKRLREVTRSSTQAFISEIKLAAALHHPCVVELIGASWTKEADLQVLLEYMDNGDLRDYLAHCPSDCGWTLAKLQIAIDVAEALVYVHSFNPPLVHRDLKSRNVLLNSGSGDGANGGELRAKLTDFGVSRYQSENNTMTAGVGTGKWLAPEVIEGNSSYGPAADIFSLGVVLSELDTHALPYAGMRGATGNTMADVALLQLVVSGKLRPSFSPTCPPKILELAEMCLSLRPEDRPSAPEVVYSLRSFKKLLSAVYVQM